MQYKIVAIFHITLLYIVLIIHQFIQITKIYDISGDPILLNIAKITYLGIKMWFQTSGGFLNFIYFSIVILHEDSI